MKDNTFDKETSTYSKSDRQIVMQYVTIGCVGRRISAGGGPPEVSSISPLLSLIKESGQEVATDIISAISSGSVVTKDYALFTLATCALAGTPDVKALVYESLPNICKRPTDLFMFVKAHCDLSRQMTGKNGWGSGFKRAIARWYNSRTASDLSYICTKYKQRVGWSHKDVLKLAHVKPATPDHSHVYSLLTQGWKDETAEKMEDKALATKVRAINSLDETSTVTQAIALIELYNLAREHIPSGLLNSPEIWGALLHGMPPTALVRNLGVMTSKGVLEVPANLDVITKKLHDPDYIKGKIHPVAVMLAIAQYSKGKGKKGSTTWTPNASIIGALNVAMRNAYQGTEKTGKAMLIGLDVSGSMDNGHEDQTLTPREASVALTSVLASTEETVDVVAFSHNLCEILLPKDPTVEDVFNASRELPFSRTDCALPIIHALQTRKVYDCFVILTDEENNRFAHSPTEMLAKYREEVNPDAKMAVICCGNRVFNGRTIGDIKDPNVIEIVGFDANTPVILNNFMKS